MEGAARRREPASGSDPTPWREIFINPDQAAATDSVAASIAGNHSLILMNDICNSTECKEIATAASRGAAQDRATRDPLFESALLSPPARGTIRKHVDAFGCRSLCDEFLQRQLQCLECVAPSLVTSLFGDVVSGATCLGNPQLQWSQGEPAINVYAPGGCFKPHTDDQSLTCLLNVSPNSGYTGGGTAFWRIGDGAATESQTKAGNGGLADMNAAPSFVIAPPEGSALIFCGSVTHAAQPITSGERVVFVASFSPRPRL